MEPICLSLVGDIYSDWCFYIQGKLHSKIEEGAEVRDLEDEGLYIGEKPYITQTNINIIENRILRQGNRWGWTRNLKFFIFISMCIQPLRTCKSSELQKKSRFFCLISSAQFYAPENLYFIVIYQIHRASTKVKNERAFTVILHTQIKKMDKFL